MTAPGHSAVVPTMPRATESVPQVSSAAHTSANLSDRLDNIAVKTDRIEPLSSSSGKCRTK